MKRLTVTLILCCAIVSSAFDQRQQPRPPRPSLDVQGTGRPGFDLRNAGAIYLQNILDRDQSTRTLQVQSQEDFIGCMAGTTPQACHSVEAHATGYFFNSVGPHVLTTESALSATIANNAVERPAQAVAFSAIGISPQARNSETWALIPAVYDNDPEGNPTSGRVTIEADSYGFGPDIYHNRIGIDVTLGTPSGAIPYQPGTFEAALRIGATNGNPRYGAWRQGIVLQQHFLKSLIDFSHASSEGDQITGINGNWKVDRNGRIEAAGFTSKLSTPTSSHAVCRPGEFADDQRFHYVCVGIDHWRRVVLDDF